MRHLTLGAVLWCVTSGAAGAATTHAAPADLAILDEVPPYLWQGPQAFQAWSADLDSDAKKRGITDQSVTISPPTREETSVAG